MNSDQSPGDDSILSNHRFNSIESRIQYYLIALICALFVTVSAETPFNSDVHSFVQTYCIDCHGTDKQKGDRAFHELTATQDGKMTIDLADEEKHYLLEDILDQLNLGEMPPKKEGVKQPSSAEIANTTKWITDTLLAKEEGARSHHTVLRRLNRREYRNTIEDLLGLHSLTTDPTRKFPADDIEEGFTNIGEALNLTESHLDQYLTTADTYLKMALHLDPPPETKTISISPEQWGAPARQKTTPWVYRLHKPGEYLDIGGGEKDLTRKVYMITYPESLVRDRGIAVSGYYKIRVNATAVRRLSHGYDPTMIPADLTQPMQLGLYIANDKTGIAASGSESRERIGLWDLKDHQPQNYEVTVWLNQGSIPFVNWDNGPGPTDYWMRDICEKYHTDIEFRGKQGAHAWHIVGKDAVPGRTVSDVWRGPRLRVREFSFTGPLPETWQSETMSRFLENKTMITGAEITPILLRFARAAFRRPVTEEEVRPYAEIFTRTRTTKGRNQKQAINLAMKAMLVSPNFLYLKETGNPDGSLTAHELANRLSYYLWSSMPDKQLFALADNGRLSDPKVLGNQVRRMLQSDKVDSFITGLCDSWLRLDKLGSMPPDSTKFREYYNHEYQRLFREETEAFLSYALKENRPISDFLKSNYTFLNQDLANHYQIEGVEGVHFRKVALRPEHRRGGLLGHASIQTLTANGVDTTPVVRGVWILENILGTPPAPPPPDIEPLDSDTRGAKSIRQRLEKHRTVETCADCHAQIDPYGFPFEYYDAVGGFRETYYRNRVWQHREKRTKLWPGQKVNGWAKIETGEAVHNLADLQNVLLSKEKQFKRALVEKLFIYATGRKMTFRDHQAIEAIVTSKQNGFRDIVLSVAKSTVFSQR